MASTKKTKAPARPFVFLNHGLWDYNAEIESARWFVVFERDVPEGERAALAEGAPPPARGLRYWGGGRIVLLESPTDRYFDSYVWRTYGPNALEDPLAENEHELTDEELATYDDDSELTKAEAQAFVDAFDAWLASVHAQHPIAFVVAWNGSRKDAWSKWSVEQVPSRVLPLLRDLEARARPPSDETRQTGSMERLIGSVTEAAIGAYLDVHDKKDLDDPLREALSAVLRGAGGHDEFVDENLSWLARGLAK
jgi:hypothetical protein